MLRYTGCFTQGPIYYQSSPRKCVPIFTEERCGGRGGHPDKIPRKKSKAQDPAQPLYYYWPIAYASRKMNTAE